MIDPTTIYLTGGITCLVTAWLSCERRWDATDVLAGICVGITWPIMIPVAILHRFMNRHKLKA